MICLKETENNIRGIQPEANNSIQEHHSHRYNPINHLRWLIENSPSCGCCLGGLIGFGLFVGSIGVAVFSVSYPLITGDHSTPSLLNVANGVLIGAAGTLASITFLELTGRR